MKGPHQRTDPEGRKDCVVGLPLSHSRILWCHGPVVRMQCGHVLHNYLDLCIGNAVFGVITKQPGKLEVDEAARVPSKTQIYHTQHKTLSSATEEKIVLMYNQVSGSLNFYKMKNAIPHATIGHTINY